MREAACILADYKMTDVSKIPPMKPDLSASTQR